MPLLSAESETNWSIPLKASKWSWERAAGWLAVLSIAMIVLMLGRPSFSNASQPQRGIDDPVLALQMATDVSDVDAILSDLPSPDRETMRLKQYLDFGFIACYAGLYLVLSVLLARGFAWGTAPAIAATVCGIAAAGFDVAENLAILHICATPLSQTTQAMVDTIRELSLAKWTLAFAALAALTSYFLASRRWTMRSIGAINTATVVIGFYGLYEHQFLPYAGIPMLLGFVGIAALFFRVR